MSGDARDFNIIEPRAVIKIFFLQGNFPKEIHAILTETLGEYAPLCAIVKDLGLTSLNVVIFPSVMRLVLDDPKKCPLRRLLFKFTNYS